MLNASGDIFGEYDVNEVMKKISGLYDVTLRIFETAQQEGRLTSEVADELARQKIAEGKVSKNEFIGNVYCKCFSSR